MSGTCVRFCHVCTFTDEALLLSVSGGFMGYSAISALNIASRDGLSLGRESTITFRLPVPFDRLLTFLVLLRSGCPGRMHRYVFASAIFQLSGPVLMRRRQPTSGLLLRSASARESRAPETGGATHAGRDCKSRLVTIAHELQPIATGKIWLGRFC